MVPHAYGIYMYVQHVNDFFPGLVGNSVVTFVYTIDRVKNSSGTLLIALSILDNILLVSALFSDVLHSVFPYTGIGHWLWDNQGYFHIIATPISKWAHTCRLVNRPSQASLLTHHVFLFSVTVTMYYIIVVL